MKHHKASTTSPHADRHFTQTPQPEPLSLHPAITFPLDRGSLEAMPLRMATCAFRLTRMLLSVKVLPILTSDILPTCEREGR